MSDKRRTLDQMDVGHWGANVSRRPEIGGRERRRADSYESRLLDDTVKQAQREAVAEWFCLHHREDERMRVLSLPDRFWSFENFLRARREVTFCGIQRDWKTLELSIPWMPKDQSDRCRATYSQNKQGRKSKSSGKKEGAIQYFSRGRNVVVYMEAADFLSTKLDWKNTGAHRRYRCNTAVWIDLFGPLGIEVQMILNRLAFYVDREKSDVPIVISFLAARDYYQSDDERTSAVIDAMAFATQTTPRDFSCPRHFKFGKTMKHQSASSPFLSLFGLLSQRDAKSVK